MNEYKQWFHLALGILTRMDRVPKIKFNFLNSCHLSASLHLVSRQTTMETSAQCVSSYENIFKVETESCNVVWLRSGSWNLFCATQVEPPSSSGPPPVTLTDQLLTLKTYSTRQEPSLIAPPNMPPTCSAWHWTHTTTNRLTKSSHAHKLSVFFF